MNQYRLFRAVSVLLMLFSLLTAVSCRGGEDVPATTVAQTTVAVSDVTSETDPSAAQTEAPDQAEQTDEAALCEAFNRQLELMFAESETEDRVDAEKMLDSMLPYLIGGNDHFATDQSYHLTNISVSGEGLTMPQEIISSDGVTLTLSSDSVYGEYREIEVSHENGVAYLSTYDGMTTVDGVTLNTESDSSPLGELDAAAMALSAEHFVAQTQEGVWEISDLYTRAVLRALLGKETVESLKNDDMSCILDTSEWEKNGALKLDLRLSSPVEMGLELKLSGIGEDSERMELTVGAADQSEIYMACARQDGVIHEMAMRIRTASSETEVVQKVSGMHTDLTMKVKAEDVVTLSCEFALDMIDESQGKGTVNVVFRMDEDGIGDIMPLSATGIESVAQGEFSIRLAGDEIALMEMEIATRAGTVFSETKMLLTDASVAVGESVMYYSVHMSDSADPTLNTSMEMDVRLVAREGDRAQYTMGLSMTDATGSSVAEAAISTPSDVTPSYTAQEEQLIGRASRYLKNYEQYAKEAEDAVNALIRKSASLDIAALPSPFYLMDQDDDGIVVLLEIVEENGGYYVYADLLLDVENTLYWYSEYDRNFRLSRRSGLLEDRNQLYQAMTAYDDLHYEIQMQSNAIGYYFEPEQGIYIICDAANIKNYGYSPAEPTPADFPGRVLHRVELNEHGQPVGELHDIVTTYDDCCVATKTCRACGWQVRAYSETHVYVAGTVICELDGARPRTEVQSCSRCMETTLTLTDAQGDTLRVLLEKATYASMTQENTFRYDPVAWEQIGSRRDLSRCMIISDIVKEGSESDGAFDCDIIIPDLRASMDLTILGIRFGDNAYQITETPGLRVVFPEGMEYIGCYGSTLFSYVTDLVLPETLLCLSEGALGGYAGTHLVLPASLTYIPDDGFHMLNLKSLTIQGAYYEFSPYLWCPNLEELICHGTFDVFRGFGTPCKIEEFVVPAGVRIISSYAFSRMSSLKKVTIGEGVVEIERQAFEDCEALVEIVLPDSLEKIGEHAFMSCQSLTRVEMRGVKVIESDAFFGCSSLEEVVVGEGLTTVGRTAFVYCSALRKINIPATATVAPDAFKGCTQLE